MRCLSMLAVMLFLFLPAYAYSIPDEEEINYLKRQRHIQSFHHICGDSNDIGNVFSVKLTENNDCLKICFKYPQFGLPEVDKTIRDWAVSYFEENRDKFLPECLRRKSYEESEYLKYPDHRFQEWEIFNMWGITTTPGTISIAFYNMGFHFNGNYPFTDLETLTFDAKGKLIGYDDLFAKTEGLWEFLSKYAEAALRLEPDFKNYDLVPEEKGLLPKAESFKYFTVSPKGFYLHFYDFQVSYDRGAASPQRCFVPLAALAKFEPKPGIWDRVGAISPSFDCAQARSPMELAICQNPILAKFDTDMDYEYKQALSKAADQEALKKEQRQWLKKTRTKCVNSNEDTNICLMVQYQTRVKQLKGH